MPISEIKIDRSFVLTMTDDPSNALIVRSVIAQGYHLSRPITAAAFDTWRTGRRGRA